MRRFGNVCLGSSATIALVTVAVFGTACPATAQVANSAPQSADPAPAPQTEAAVSDIVVTARKVREFAVAVPVSISSLSGAQLQDKRITALNSLAVYVPNFTFSNGSTGTFRSMRGGGSAGSSFSFEQSTGLFVDDASFGRNEQGRMPIFDMENVDVLRGPQAITFGNSTTAGAVALTTRKPGRDFTADLSAQYEFNAHETTLRGGVTVPLGDKVSVRASGYFDNLAKGWVHNLYPSRHPYGPANRDAAGRIIMVLEPTDNTTITLKYEHDSLRSWGTVLGLYEDPLHFPFLTVTGLGTTVNRGQPAPFNVDSDFMRMNQDIFYGQLRTDLGFATLTSTTSYWQFQWNQGANTSHTTAAGGFYETRDHFREFSNETRLSGDLTDNVSFLAGTYVSRGLQHAQSVQSFNQAGLGIANPLPPFARTTDLDMRVWTLSGFADLTWKLGKFAIEPGFRYTRVWRHGEQQLYGADVISGDRNPALDQYILAAKQGIPHDFQGLEAPEKHAMPQIVVSYRASQNLNFFVRAVRGVKAGGLDWTATGSDPATAIFKPEKAVDVEAGFKARLADNKVDLAVTAFHTDYTDVQTSVLTNGRFITANAASSVSKGVETSLTVRPVLGMTVGASLSYLDAHYTKFPNGTCTVALALVSPAPCSQDLSGVRTPFASKWSATAHVDYAIPIGSGTVTPSVDGVFRSSYNPSSSSDPLAQQPSLFLLDARLVYAPAGARWQISAYGKNLLDKEYPGFISAGGSSGIPFASTVSLQRPREVGVQLDVKW
ncbi:TonB-dependent receptor [Sphingomonas sp. MMS24-J13]|uniref:TonB-dependent receptor n=1 Tax=Sphingomonas sp. MMS24-J13 TaxID=3238686 RepID=UPI00384AD0ED